MKTLKPWFLFGSAMLLLLVHGAPAQAMRIGNPAPDIAQGDFGLGATFSDERAGVFLEFGITDAGTLEALVNQLETGPGADGTEVGIGYRHKLNTNAKLGNMPLRLAVLGRYSQATIDVPGIGGIGSEFDYSLLQLGFGGAFTPVENLNVHGAVIYEQVELEEVITIPFFGTLRQPIKDTGLGLSGGAEYWVTPQIVVGGELHPGLFHNDVAVYGEFKF